MGAKAEDIIRAYICAINLERKKAGQPRIELVYQLGETVVFMDHARPSGERRVRLDSRQRDTISKWWEAISSSHRPDKSQIYQDGDASTSPVPGSPLASHRENVEAVETKSEDAHATRKTAFPVPPKVILKDYVEAVNMRRLTTGDPMVKLRYTWVGPGRKRVPMFSELWNPSCAKLPLDQQEIAAVWRWCAVAPAAAHIRSSAKFQKALKTSPAINGFINDSDECFNLGYDGIYFDHPGSRELMSPVGQWDDTECNNDQVQLGDRPDGAEQALSARRCSTM